MNNGNSDYMIVPISGGYTIISIEDADVLNGYNWFIDRDGYATAFSYNGKVSSVRLHHLIAGKQQGLLIDHKNRVRLDNRRCNLDHVTYKESAANRGIQVKGTDTPYLQDELHCPSGLSNEPISVAVKGLRDSYKNVL